MRRSSDLKPSSSHHLNRLIVAIPVAGAMVLAGTFGASAFFFPDRAAWDHFVTCFGYMLTDQQAHHDQCSPFKGPPIEGTITSGATAPVPGSSISTTSGTTTTTTTITTTTQTTTTTVPSTTSTIETTIERTIIAS